MVQFLTKLLARFKSFFVKAPAQPMAIVPPLATEVQALIPLSLSPVIPSVTDNFQFAFKYVLPNEGGFVNDPNDAGGATNFGITRADLAAYRGHAVTVSDVQHMTIDEAKAIYRANYWSNIGLDHISRRAIAICLFDQGVLNGPHRGVAYAQLAVNKCGISLLADGILGPLTLAALNKVDTKQFLLAIRSLLISHYYSIVAGQPNQRKFLQGWINRADRLLTLT